MDTYICWLIVGSILIASVVIGYVISELLMAFFIGEIRYLIYWFRDRM